MNKFFKNKTFKTTVIILFLLISVAVYSYLNYENDALYNVFSAGVYPFQKSFSWVSDKAENFSSMFKEKEELHDKINSLETEVNTLRDKVVEYNELKKENEQFLKYYDFKKENDSLKFVPASVIGMDMPGFFKNFTVDKGYNAGISKDDIVITENGVIGCVYKVGAVCSKVRSILSPDIKICVSDIETGESGVISGRADIAKDNLTSMMFIPAQNSMKPGDIVATTGISGMYPKNLKLGKIKSIGYDDNESSYYAVVEPFENLKETKDVFIITDFRGKGEISTEDD